MGGRFLSEAEATRLVGPPTDPPPDPAALDRLKRDTIVLIKRIGLIQTGQPVNTEWVFHAAAKLGERALGVIDFAIDRESNPAALAAVHDEAREQLKYDAGKAAVEAARGEEEIPF